MNDDSGYRRIPSVDAITGAAETQVLLAGWGRAAVTDAARALQAMLREEISAGENPRLDMANLSARLSDRLARGRGRGPRPILNLTGTVLHTNLGRARLPPAAVLAASAAAAGNVDLEYDSYLGQRGERDDHVRSLIMSLTGAEDATVVNNNAAAVLLVLNSLALGRSVPVSRGELVEIGGSFRLPDIMARAGCSLVEVGTTNRTHARDFEAAIDAETSLIMKVHLSNFRMEGFTAAVSERNLATLAHEHQLPFVVDLGSGALVDMTKFGLPAEPMPRAILEQGADLVTFSGDKLLGGPQAGIIAGRKDLIARLNANPLKRALRIDKMTMAALAEVLKLCSDPERAEREMPVLRDLARDAGDIAAQAERLRRQVQAALPDCEVTVTAMESEVGSGAMAARTLASAGLKITANSPGPSIDDIAARFRGLPIPVIGHVRRDAFWLDLRCLDNDDALAGQLKAAAWKTGAD